MNWQPSPDWDHEIVDCKGKFIRQVCNFGVGDLSRVQASSCLFANKFNLDVDEGAVSKHFQHVVNVTLNETYAETVNKSMLMFDKRCNKYCV